MECTYKITTCTNEFWKLNGGYVCNPCFSQKMADLMNQGFNISGYHNIEKLF